MPPITRGTRGVLAALVLTLVVACADDDGRSSDPQATSAPTNETSPPASMEQPSSSDVAGAFPVTIENAGGEVTIEAQPDVVVSVGRTDHDVLLALGIRPAAVYQFVPTMERGVGAWAEPLLGDATPALLTNPLNFEQITALDPDLITDVMTVGDESQYDTLSSIAPTIGLPPGDATNAVPWQEVTTRIAAAVGREAGGAQLVADTEAFLADTATSHPELAGKSVSVLLTSPDGIGVYTAADTRMQLLTALGMVPSPYVADLGTDDYFHQLSAERVEDADADVVVVLDRMGAPLDEIIQQHPTIGTMSANADGRLFAVEDFDVTLALSGASVLSIPFATEALLPSLQDAVASP